MNNSNSSFRVKVLRFEMGHIQMPFPQLTLTLTFCSNFREKRFQQKGTMYLHFRPIQTKKSNLITSILKGSC